MYSVIIPSLGRLEYLNELIISVLGQTVRPQEILVLLDENEHCRKIANFIVTNDSLRIFFCSNLNLAEKRNYGVTLVLTENILFSDDDDIWEPIKGALVCEALKQSSVCCHNYGKFGFEIAINCSKFGEKNKRLISKSMLAGANRFGGGSSIAAKRCILLALPFSRDFRYCEDFEWWSRVLFVGIEVQYLGTSLVNYRTHANNMTKAVNTVSHFGYRLSLRIATMAFLMLATSIMICLRSILKKPLYLFRKN